MRKVYSSKLKVESFGKSGRKKDLTQRPPFAKNAQGKQRGNTKGTEIARQDAGVEILHASSSDVLRMTT